MSSKTHTTVAIILAGGTGSRMGRAVPKQFLELGGMPVLSYSLIAYENSRIDKIFIVANEAFHSQILSEMIEVNGISKFAGFAVNGEERVFSVKNGVECAIANEGDDIYLLIHDGARPFITPELINMCIDEVVLKSACVPGVALKDTIKRAEPDGRVVDTPDRSKLFAVQTPQCFKANVLVSAYEGFETERADGSDGFIPTDDASLVERFTDTDVYVVPGDEGNIKITTPLDLRIAEMMLSEA